MVMLRDNFKDAAYLVLLAFGCYLRPSEPHKLQVQDLIPPVKGSCFKHWSILLHPLERGVSSKTQEYDESLAIDHPFLKALGPAIIANARGRRPGDPLFSVSQAQMSRLFT